ncbi:MAG: uroporphyrinogen decarboxylase family protein, partial [Desulfobacterales bacterium]
PMYLPPYSPADFDSISPPDPNVSGRLPWIRQFSKIFLDLTGKLERVYFTAPFSIAVNIRGYENLIQDIYERPDFVHRLFEFLCDEVISPFIDVLRSEVGNSNLIIDGRDAWASPPMITLDMMDEFVVPYTERLRDKLGDKLITRGNWGDGRIRDIDLNTFTRL